MTERREGFDWDHHARSNSESPFFAVKRRLGEPVNHHTRLARLNELMGKILAYNIWVITREIYVHNIDRACPSERGRSLTFPR
ncbi:MAG: hypothetical protein L3K17_06615 [Thermoplasmata archaeon]|nr:hypothetical protein [Thermoplasmata archaeon]